MQRRHLLLGASALGAALADAGLTQGASEYHGALCGMLCCLAHS